MLMVVDSSPSSWFDVSRQKEDDTLADRQTKDLIFRDSLIHTTELPEEITEDINCGFPGQPKTY
jgi:hypothetical protein